jgi:hypothetical protein
MISRNSNKSLCHILIGAFFLFLPSYVLAQKNSPYFKPYASLGLCSSQISGDQLSGFNQIGLSGGYGIKIGHNETWAPRLEIFFTQKGSRKNARPDEGDYNSYFLKLNYVEVPLTLDFAPGKTGFHFGLSPAYLVSATEENQNGEIPGLGREFKSYDLNGILGIQYRFHERWELATRYSQSILPVREHAGNTSFRLNQGQYNSTIQFMLRFNLLYTEFISEKSKG